MNLLVQDFELWLQAKQIMLHPLYQHLVHIILFLIYIFTYTILVIPENILGPYKNRDFESLAF